MKHLNQDIIKVRKPHLEFDDSIPKHWNKNNPVATHGFNALNILFPASERFFINSVNNYKDQITCPILKQQVKGFTGQETMHANEHERYFDFLESQGYRFRGFLNLFERYMMLTRRSGFTKFNLASTAAAEHYTATLAGIALSEPSILEDINLTMKKFFVWHACEEIEHRSVAYDVMATAGVNYSTRILAYLLVTFDVLTWLAIFSYKLLRQDGLSFWQIWQYKKALKKQTKCVPKKVRKAFRVYFHRDFHPSKYDNEIDIVLQLKKVGIVD